MDVNNLKVKNMISKLLSITYEIAKNLGYQSCKSGRNETENPYKNTNYDDLYNCWMKGFNKAKFKK